MRNISLHAALVAALTIPTTAQSRALSTLMTGGNGGSTGWIVFFDATVAATNPNGLLITGFDHNCSSGANLPITVNVWTTPLTFVGNERNASAWTLVATGSGTTAATNSPSYTDVSDFVLPSGPTGIAIQVNGSGVSYTNGSGSNQAYSDANLALALGASLSTQFLSTGSYFNPRVWNGTVYYATVGDATYGAYGAGCSGTSLVPKLAASAGSYPSVGKSLSLDIGNGPVAPTPATVTLGFSKKTMSLTVPLPIDLTVIGMAGCMLYVDPLINTGLALIGGTAKVVYPIPLSTSLYGLALYHQAFLIDPTANQLGVSATNAGEGWIGK
jgi:hypothetical protein